MAENSTIKSVKPTLEVAIIAGLTLAANKLITTLDLRERATTAAPFVGGGIAWALRRVSRYIHYRQLLSLEEKWLANARARRANGNLTLKDAQALDKDIAKRVVALEKLQRDNLLIQ